MMFKQLKIQPIDPIIALMQQARADTRAQKIDLGVGIYQDEHQRTPVMQAVTQAENRILQRQDSKKYIGIAGDVDFRARIIQLAIDAEFAKNVACIQTVGGSGALFLASNLLKQANQRITIHLPTPTWGNHQALLSSCSLASYPYYNADTQTVDYAAMLQHLEQHVKRGDCLLIHGCCHNPTGMDLTLQQWRQLGDFCVNQGITPLIDVAYHGFGASLEQDKKGWQAILKQVPEALISYSCSKNFGLYRERVGALMVFATDEEARNKAYNQLCILARRTYSMPPDHGARIVDTILQDNKLVQLWQQELADMVSRLKIMRNNLAQIYSHIAHTQGMFTQLSLTKECIEQLRIEQAVYILDDGRINLCALNEDNIDNFLQIIQTK